MKSDALEMQVLRSRLERLETQYRRMKWAGLILLTAVCAVFLMGETVPPARVVEAQRFVLRDSDGRVRGWLGMIGKGSELTLGNVNAQPMMDLIVGTDTSDLHLYGNQNSGMTLGVNSGEPAISMAGAEGVGKAEISAGKSGPHLQLSDRSGVSTVLGSTQLPSAATGGARQTSAASVVLFDSRNNVIWHVP